MAKIDLVVLMAKIDGVVVNQVEERWFMVTWVKTLLPSNQKLLKW